MSRSSRRNRFCILSLLLPTRRVSFDEPIFSFSALPSPLAKAATKPADFFFEVNPDSLFERRWRPRQVKLVTAKTMHVLANKGGESCDHLEASLGSF